jgi:hypothetical protein
VCSILIISAHSLIFVRADELAVELAASGLSFASGSVLGIG